MEVNDCVRLLTSEGCTGVGAGAGRTLGRERSMCKDLEAKGAQHWKHEDPVFPGCGVRRW